MKKRNCRCKAIAERRAEAKARDAAHAKRNAKEQLRLLDERLGAGVGAERERALLEAIKSRAA